MMKLLAFDPSGNWSEREGKGTTGWALFESDKLEAVGFIEAENFNSVEEYWQAHLSHISDRLEDVHQVHTIVCESYKLQPGKAMQQSWSSLETPQLIGAMRMHNFTTFELQHKFVLQDPSIKTRFNDDILVEMGILNKRGNRYYWGDTPVNLHIRDAIRHGLYYLRYGGKA